MFAPIRARFASSFSRNGIIAVATEIDHLRGDVDIVDQFTLDSEMISSRWRQMTRALAKRPSSSSGSVGLRDDDSRPRRRRSCIRLSSVTMPVALSTWRNGASIKPYSLMLRKGRQIVNQADVRAFRRLDRAHTAIVGVVNVSDVEGCAVTRQTAGAQCGQTALVRQLRQRVVLIHELRQRGGAEELLDRPP